MRKRNLCLLAVAMLIVSVSITGCTTSDQVNQASSSETSTNATTSSTTTATISSAASVSPTAIPSPSASPTAATRTPASVKTATAITPNQFYLTGGSSPNLWGFSLRPKASTDQLCGSGFVLSISIDGHAAGSLSNPCGQTAALSQEQIATLSTGHHTFTIKYAGDSTYQSSEFVGTV